jgi:hypothetical protein
VTSLTTTEWHRIVKAAEYFPDGRKVALKKLRDILGRQRTLDQNRLQMMWHKEAAQQLGDETAEQKRAYCKLHFGVSILHAENEHFRAEYDRVMGPLPYETKLALMAVPFDFPVTRLMTKQQKSDYLEAVRQHYLSLGVQLTIPEDARVG